MTREQALALARLVSELDAVPLLDPIRVEQRSRGTRRVWSVFSNYSSTGKNVGLVIDDATRVIVEKQYVGFGDRQGQPFGGQQYSAEFSLVEREQFVAAARVTVFALFACLAGQRAISPSSLEWLSSTPNELCEGASTEWRVRFRGRSRAMTLRVEQLRPNERLTFRQERGPFGHFRHALQLGEAPGGTMIRERLEYRLPCGVAGALVGSLLGVSREIEAVLNARHAAVAERFGAP